MLSSPALNPDGIIWAWHRSYHLRAVRVIVWTCSVMTTWPPQSITFWVPNPDGVTPCHVPSIAATYASPVLKLLLACRVPTKDRHVRKTQNPHPCSQSLNPPHPLRRFFDLLRIGQHLLNLTWHWAATKSPMWGPAHLRHYHLSYNTVSQNIRILKVSRPLKPCA